ncbi:hypothetical protein BH11CYA1_BH11CYA1_33110 [soil metagenome]
MKTGFSLVCSLLVSQIILPATAQESQYYSAGMVKTRLEGKHGIGGLYQCFSSKPLIVKRPENPTWYKDLAHAIEKNCPAPLIPGAKYILTFKDGKIGKLTPIATSGSAELDAIGAEAIRKSMPFKGIPVNLKSHLYRLSILIMGKEVTIQRFPRDES